MPLTLHFEAPDGVADLDDRIVMGQGIEVIVEDCLANDVQGQAGKEVLHLYTLASRSCLQFKSQEFGFEYLQMWGEHCCHAKSGQLTTKWSTSLSLGLSHHRIHQEKLDTVYLFGAKLTVYTRFYMIRQQKLGLACSSCATPWSPQSPKRLTIDSRYFL